MHEILNDNLSEFVAENGQVVVLYGASWCGNCRMVKPKVKRLAGETEGVKFVYVDAEKNVESRQLAEIKNLPTFAAFKDGKLVSQKMGSKIDIAKEMVDEIAGD